MTRLATTQHALTYVVDTLADPKAAFIRLRGSTNDWITISAIVGVLAAILQYVEFSSLTRAVAQTADMHRTVNTVVLVSVIVAPLVIVLRAVLVGYLLWVGTVFVDISLPLTPFFAGAACAQVVVLVHKSVNVLTQEILHVPLRGNFEIGLNLLVQTHSWIDPFLGMLNPFSLWYIAVLGMVVAVLGKLHFRKAVLALVPYMSLYLIAFMAQNQLFGHF
jgi:hypothetical protein